MISINDDRLSIHPDRGGSVDRFTEVQSAADEATKA